VKVACESFRSSGARAVGGVMFAFGEGLPRKPSPASSSGRHGYRRRELYGVALSIGVLRSKHGRNKDAVCKSINKPLTIWAVERRLFFLTLIMGGATFNLFGSLPSGLVMFTAL
jgi:hypothetical protein